MLTRPTGWFVTATLIMTTAATAAAGNDDPPPTITVSPIGDGTTTIIDSPGSRGSTSPGSADASTYRCVWWYDPTGSVSVDYSGPWGGEHGLTQDLLSGAAVWFGVDCPGQPTQGIPVYLGANSNAGVAGGMSPGVLAAQVRDHLSLPAPQIGLNPNPTVVNLPTWLWVNPASYQVRVSTLSLRGETVTVAAVPIRTDWSTGEGGLTCFGPGLPYDPSQPNAPTPCAWTYRRSSAGQPRELDQIRVDVVWQVRWFANGLVSEQGQLPDLDRSATTTLRVREVDALVTR